jgi:hypothetical protein
MDGHIQRSDYAEFHSPAVDRHYLDRDTVANDDRLSKLATENQHDCSSVIAESWESLFPMGRIVTPVNSLLPRTLLDFASGLC